MRPRWCCNTFFWVKPSCGQSHAVTQQRHQLIPYSSSLMFENICMSMSASFPQLVLGFSNLICAGTSVAGFLRFLHLLASHPWSIQALIVDPAGDLTREARQQLLADHEASKQDGSAPALPIYSPADALSLWTRYRPTKAVVGRLAKLAVQSLQALQVKL